MATIDTYALISLAYLKTYAGYAGTADDDRLIDAINAVSDRIENWCNRHFKSRSYTQFYEWSGDNMLRLRELPVVSVESLATGFADALSVQYTGSGYNAWVSVDDTNLKTNSISGATTTTSTHALATYATLSTMATQIATVSGWTASVLHTNSAWGTAQFIPASGLNAKSPYLATLRVPDTPLEDFDVDTERGLIYMTLSSSVDPARWEGNRRSPYGGAFAWPPSRRVRVSYTAGYATVPEDVQLACAELTKEVFDASSHDGTLQSETIGSYSYTNAAETALGGGQTPTLNAIRDKLVNYRRHPL